MSFIVVELNTVLLLLLAILLSPTTRAQQALFPAAIPLAVRSPYLSCWDHVTNGTVFGQLWPATYNQSQVVHPLTFSRPRHSHYRLSQALGWTVLVRVDGVTYSFMGNTAASIVNGTVNMTSVAVTPTQTVVTAQAGRMQVNLTFLNPIEPSDWVKQSIPFSYMAFSAKSIDGSAHTVQVYSDVSGEWSSGNSNDTILWSATANGNVIYHMVYLQAPATFSEVDGQASWGRLYYAMKQENNVTYKIAAGDVARGWFPLNGALDNQVDTAFRAINDGFPVFAMSRDLGTIQSTQDPVVWTVGYTTDPAVNYTGQLGAYPAKHELYYRKEYGDDGSLIVDFLNDFSDAFLRAQQLDQKILQDAASVSNLLGDLVSLAIHQVYGSMQLTIGTDEFGRFNEFASDLVMFMKNIGGAEPNRVNAVETLYAAFPALMYIDPTLGAPLLEPLLRFQASPNYTIPYAASDLGSNYPNVTGSNSTHNQGVEQTANMLIMTYAQARASGDGSLISRYYRLLTSWADYLSNSTSFIQDQLSADGLSVSDQTNLAIKGIIAIQAMSHMSSIANQAVDAEKYSIAAQVLYRPWRTFAIFGLGNDPHILAAYFAQPDSWTLGYNLFADVWLETGLVELSVYNAHSSFILNTALNSTPSDFGLPVDNVFTDTVVAVSSWNLFVAAMTTDQGLRSNLISRVHNKAFSNASVGVFPVIYDSLHGTTIQGAASPAQGAMFAPLALNAPVHAIQANVTTRATPRTLPSKSHVVTVAGSVIGGLVAAVAALIGAVVFVRCRRRQDRRRKSLESSLGSVEVGPLMIVTPFDLNAVEVEEVHQNSTQEMEQQQLLSEPPQAQTSIPSTLHPTPSSSRERPVPPILVGLSSKELARLRSQQNANPPSNEPQSTSSSTGVTVRNGTRRASETRRLQSEVESLRREMQRLRTERFGAPPSYTSGNV
ncbi:hypothetical protein F5148DRAFT_990760 [Russula earlei]|uniref:Uncharacterized protein n=1 Tax=Russula earlei TaxID=71964 RepID=A0ACC0UPH0_9AGAM|nr:hypothetical protein F5148DRAFT_990760 [Russula earlei]